MSHFFFPNKFKQGRPPPSPLYKDPIGGSPTSLRKILIPFTRLLHWDIVIRYTTFPPSPLANPSVSNLFAHPHNVSVSLSVFSSLEYYFLPASFPIPYVPIPDVS